MENGCRSNGRTWCQTPTWSWMRSPFLWVRKHRRSKDYTKICGGRRRRRRRSLYLDCSVFDEQRETLSFAFGGGQRNLIPRFFPPPCPSRFDEKVLLEINGRPRSYGTQEAVAAVPRCWPPSQILLLLAIPWVAYLRGMYFENEI